MGDLSKKNALQSKLKNLQNEKLIFQMKDINVVLNENDLKLSDIFEAIKSGKISGIANDSEIVNK